MIRTRTAATTAALLLGAPLAALAQIVPSTPSTADVNLALGLERSAVIDVDLNGVPGQAATAWVPMGGVDRLMVLQPHSNRSDKYEVVEHLGGDEYRNVEPSVAKTYRGEILDMPGVKVAASWLEDGLYARIMHEDGTSEWIEPLVGRVANAEFGDYAFYADEDVEALRGTCGTSAAGAAASGPAVNPGQFGPEIAFGSSLSIAELGVDTDFEYFQDYGSTTAVENRINSIINTMNLQYETEVFVTHQITTIIVRTNSNDPYTTTSASTFLGQFRSHWLSSQGSVQRDVAHLFTGKNLQGGTIGIAYLGVICSNNLGYGLVESDCCGSFATKTDLSAHELGHNWNADHCSCQNPNYTMNPFLLAANRFSPTQTIPAMINYVNNRPCLDDGVVPGGPPAITSTTPNAIPAVSADSPVTVTLNGSGFNDIDGVTANGQVLTAFPPQFQIVSDTELRVTFAPPYTFGGIDIVVTEGSDTASVTVPVTFNTEPVIDLVNSDPSFIVTALPIQVYMGGLPGDIHFLLVSTSNLPTSVPGLFNADIGNNLTSLFLIGSYTVDINTGFALAEIPVSGLQFGTQLFFQSVVLEALFPTIPLPGTNVESGTVLF